MSASLTRRALVGTAPAAVLAASLPALASTHPDAEIIGHATRLAQAAARRDELSILCDEAYKRFDPHPTPEVLLWRRDDQWYVCPDPAILDSIEEVEGKPRYTYDTEGAAEMLTAKVAGWKAVANRLSGVDDAIVRAEAILAALKIYKAEEAKALAACGYAAVDAACCQQEALIADLVQLIAAAPARTPEGVCAKARAALDASGRPHVMFEHVEFAGLLHRADRRPRDDERLLLMSAVLDAVGQTTGTLKSGITSICRVSNTKTMGGLDA